MRVPKGAVALLRRVAPGDRADEVLGDLEEAHGRRVERRGARVAVLLTWLEALDMAFVLIRERRRGAPGSGRGRRLLRNVSWLDFKLGARMLVKYPGLTVVGGLAMALAIWLGAGTFEFVSQLAFPRLGLSEGDRIVGLRLWDASAGRVEPRVTHDLAMWRAELESVGDLGAFVTADRNFGTGTAQAEPIEVAEMSAAGFRVARVPPLLGRPLVEEDERPGAAPVIVLGYDLWRTRLEGDPAVIGRTVRLDALERTIVGVMPEGFGFPVHHDAWTPLALDALAHGPRAGPALRIFGRLAPGATLESARAELATLGGRAAADFPDTHEHLRPEIMPYAKSVLGVIIVGPALFSWAMMSTNLALILLLVAICSNVALLMFARAATRETEIIVRNALGASRGRIIMQLFAEALVLAGVATLLGLAAAGAGLRWGLGVFEATFAELPFWIRPRLSPMTVAYACVLALIGAAVAGVVPALRITRHVGARLKEATPGGGGIRFGGVWTAVIILQVALTVTFPAVAFFLQRDRDRIEAYDMGIALEDYVGVRLELDRVSARVPADTSRAAFVERYTAAFAELERRVAAVPAAAGVSFTDRLPRMYHQWNQIEVLEGAIEPPDERGHRVASVSIEVDYFDVLETPMSAGRAFHSGDLRPDARTVIVNRPFVDAVLGGRQAVGLHVRYVANESDRAWEPGPWHEIVGVVPDLGTQSGYGRAGIYHAADLATLYPAYMMVRVRGAADAFMPRLRAIAMDVDPSLRLHGLMTLDHVLDGELRFYRFWFVLTVVVSAIALLLSLAGIYAVVAFTVARRTREIGIRVALGAEPRGVAASILRRPLTHIAAGIALGAALTAALSFGLMPGRLLPRLALMSAYATLMLGVCLLACVVPVRRALGIEPTQAMRTEG